MIFRYKDEEYNGATAVEVVRQIQRGEARFDASQADGSIREFLEWSLENLSDRLPPRELDLNIARVDDEVRAQSYLSLRHEYGIGELVE